MRLSSSLDGLQDRLSSDFKRTVRDREMVGVDMVFSFEIQCWHVEKSSFQNSIYVPCGICQLTFFKWVCKYFGSVPERAPSDIALRWSAVVLTFRFYRHITPLA